jgi:GTPase
MSENSINEDFLAPITVDDWIEGDEIEESEDLLYEVELRDLDPTSLAQVVIIGRPNVGKSTLVNRLIGRQAAVVEDRPGVTRDRVSYVTEWGGKTFTMVDTGGLDTDKEGFSPLIAAKVKDAVDLADLILFVVDARVGATSEDNVALELIRRGEKPVLLIANKADSQKDELNAAALWNLGLDEPYPVSALHGRSIGDLLDLIVSKIPEDIDTKKAQKIFSVAIAGRPNVGKSSLLNALTKSERAVVSPIAGTTIDPIDEIVSLEDSTWRFIDTAGIRKRGKQSEGAEYFSVLRTQSAIDRADLVLLLLDASDPISDQDRKLINLTVEAGRGLVLVFNKWDLVEEERQTSLEREIDTLLFNVKWAPRINISAKTTWHVNRIEKALLTALAGWQKRIPTGQINQFLKTITASHPHPVRGGKQPKVLFMTQVGAQPPVFALFTTGGLDAGYVRFIERRLREEFGFEGSPIHMRVRRRRR